MMQIPLPKIPDLMHEAQKKKPPEPEGPRVFLLRSCCLDAAAATDRFDAGSPR